MAWATVSAAVATNPATLPGICMHVQPGICMHVQPAQHAGNGLPIKLMHAQPLSFQRNLQRKLMHFTCISAQGFGEAWTAASVSHASVQTVQPSAWQLTQTASPSIQHQTALP